MALIEMTGVEKSYELGGVVVPALRGVNLTVQSGELTVLMGPSGSGKSTLLHILGLLDRPTAGRYLLEGKSVGDVDFDALADLRNRRIGFIFQSFNLIPVLDVIENIELPRMIRGEHGGALRKRAHALAEQVGLTSVMRHRPDQLSGGQRQRVAVARALITEPALVLADEPTANLDGATTDQILELMTRLNRDLGTTFLFSTHDPRVERRARRILRIVDGIVEEALPPHLAVPPPAGAPAAP